MQPVGSSRGEPIDVRVIAATDSDLEASIDRGEFRAPLLHRLAGFEIEAPALRDRREDIGRLLVHFLREELEETAELSKLEPAAPGARQWLSAGLVARLAMLDWPGNVRQLRNLARQLVIGSRGLPELRLTGSVRRLIREESGEIQPGPSQARQPERPRTSHRPPTDIADDELLEALRRNRYRVKGTAEDLGVARTSLYDLMERHPNVRKASDLGRAEVLQAAEKYNSNIRAMAEALEVSPEGLQKRLRDLGLL